MITKAFIFAGGLGTRLRPYTDITPKPLIKLYEKPVIEYIISNLSRMGVKDITINTFYLKEQFESILELSNKYEVNLILSRQPELFLHAGDIAFAKDFWMSLKDDELFYAVNGDTLIYVDDSNIQEATKLVNKENPFLVFGTNLNNNSLKINNKDEIVGCKEYFYDDSVVTNNFYQGENTGMQIIHSSINKYLPKQGEVLGFYDQNGLISRIIKDSKKVKYYNLTNFKRFELSTAHDFENYKDSQTLKEVISLINP